MEDEGITQREHLRETGWDAVKRGYEVLVCPDSMHNQRAPAN